MSSSDQGVVKTQKEAAELIGIDSRQLGRLKKEADFPSRDDGQFDTVRIIDWMADRAGGTTQDDDDDGTLPTTEFVTVTIKVPVCEPTGFIGEENLIGAFSHVDCHIRDAQQLLGLRWGHMGCLESHSQFASGKHVDTRAEFVKYLFEQIGGQVAELLQAEQAA